MFGKYIKDMINESQPGFYFCSFKNRTLYIHNSSGSIVANITVPISGNGVIVGADTDSTAAYVCVTTSVRKVYAYKRNGKNSNSWSLSRIYGI